MLSHSIKKAVSVRQPLIFLHLIEVERICNILNIFVSIIIWIAIVIKRHRKLFLQLKMHYWSIY